MKKYHYLRVVLSGIVVLSMLVSLVPATVSAAAGTAPQKGTGTSADPYIIDEPLELVWMGENFGAIKNKYFRQTVDIDMSSVANFTPIGNGTTSSWGDPFSGQYNGLGFRIRNLTISSDLAYFGLFQNVGGTVENVILNAVNITATGTYSYISIGGIAGYAYNGTISNCGVSGNLSINGISGTSNVGGICGQCDGTTKITNSYCTATLTNSNTFCSIGGIAGYTLHDLLSVDHCYFAGTIIGTPLDKGAIIGNNYLGIYTNNVYLDISASFALGSTKTDTGCTRATAALMKTTAPYLTQGWDFENRWKLDAVTGYPTFITAPGVPANVIAQSGDNQFTVSWDAAAYASGYNVYYGTTASLYNTPFAVSGTSAVISGVSNITKYYICIRALHGSTEGAASTEVTCVPHITISDLTATGSNSSVDFTFTAATGASSVELQQSTNNGSSYAAVAGVSLTNSSTGTTLTGIANGMYMYRLRLIFAGTEAYSNTAAINVFTDTDATLKNIKIGGTDIAGFLPSTLDYTYTALYGTDLAGLVFTSTCSDANAAQSAWTYDSVNHKWSVTVTAQDTSVQRTYCVTVAEGQATGVLADYRTNTLSYMSHVQDIGWQDAVSNGNYSGTTGQSKRLEAIKINLLGIAGGIEYCTHVQDIGWMDWTADGNVSGTTAQSKRLEAIKIRLTGEAADKYDIYYQVHVQDTGWMDWAKNGESAGTAACSYRMESIQIVMVLKGDPAPGSTAKAFYNGLTGTYNEQ